MTDKEKIIERTKLEKIFREFKEKYDLTEEQAEKLRKIIFGKIESEVKI